MEMDVLFFTLAGAIVAGFVNGLAGFGTSLFSLGFWLQVFPPLEAVALSVATSIATGVQGLWVVRKQTLENVPRLLRFLLPALIGIPIGILALNWVEPIALKLLIATLLLTYGAFFIVRGSLPKFERPTPIADRAVGFLGGILGGLAGLSGALLVMWCALRPWPRHETRAVLQPFNFVILAITCAILAFRGAYQFELLTALGIVLVASFFSAQMGIALFKRISDTQFRWLLIALMFASGLALLIREVIGLL